MRLSRCISTILDSGNHYSKMMEMRDAYGNYIFQSIRITLVCGALFCAARPGRPTAERASP